MTTSALVLFGIYLGVGFGLRTYIQVRRTGDSGFRGISGSFGTAEWWAGALFVVALAAGVLGPISASLGVEPLDALSAPVIQWTGVVVTLVEIVATFVTQLEMGTSWRIGVDETEHTDLVTTGPFALVRNPIFSAMAATGAGLAFMVPNVVSLLGLLLLMVALELQVRVVEEPFLRRLHGTDYESYAARVGRFLPSLGRLAHSAPARVVG